MLVEVDDPALATTIRDAMCAAAGTVLDQEWGIVSCSQLMAETVAY